MRLARRRIAGFLAVLALVVLALALPAVAVRARAGDFPSLRGQRFGDVRVDVRPLLALGGGAQAEALRADLTAALRSRFSARIGGKGPALVVLVRGFSLRPYTGGGGGDRSRFGGGGMQNDCLDGEALLVGRDGAVLGRHPQLTATPSSFGGAWYDPQSERRRVTAIADIYADWLVRDLPVD